MSRSYGWILGIPDRAFNRRSIGRRGRERDPRIAFRVRDVSRWIRSVKTFRHRNEEIGPSAINGAGRDGICRRRTRDG